MRRVNSIVLKNANVISVRDGDVAYGCDVYIENGRIIRVYPAGEVADYAGRLSVNCTDKYVMPAFWDMHVHLFNDEFLDYLLSYGVTTALNMWGFPKTLKWRKRVRAGLRQGPDVYTTSPILDGQQTYPLITVVTNADEAKRAVLSAKKAGYDFIKIYNNLTLPVYEEIARAAKKLGMRVIGHLPNCVNDDYAEEKGKDYPILQASIDHILFLNDNNLHKIVEQGVYLTPTFTVEDAVRFGAAEEAEIPIAELRKGIRTIYWKALRGQHRTAGKKNPVKTVRKDMEEYDRLFREFLRAGGKVMLGTDCGFPDVVPGFSMHQELARAVSHGMTPAEAIRAATLTPAEFLGRDLVAGTVEAGKEAQLLILNGNPLDDLNETLNIYALLKRDEFYDAEALRLIRKRAHGRPEILVDSVFRRYMLTMGKAFLVALVKGAIADVKAFFRRIRAFFVRCKDRAVGAARRIQAWTLSLAAVLTRREKPLEDADGLPEETAAPEEPTEEMPAEETGIETASEGTEASEPEAVPEEAAGIEEPVTEEAAPIEETVTGEQVVIAKTAAPGPQSASEPVEEIILFETKPEKKRRRR